MRGGRFRLSGLRSVKFHSWRGLLRACASGHDFGLEVIFCAHGSSRQAAEHLEGFGERAELLRALAAFVVERRS